MCRMSPGSPGDSGSTSSPAFRLALNSLPPWPPVPALPFLSSSSWACYRTFPLHPTYSRQPGQNVLWVNIWLFAKGSRWKGNFSATQSAHNGQLNTSITALKSDWFCKQSFTRTQLHPLVHLVSTAALMATAGLRSHRDACPAWHTEPNYFRSSILSSIYRVLAPLLFPGVLTSPTIRSSGRCQKQQFHKT